MSSGRQILLAVILVWIADILYFVLCAEISPFVVFQWSIAQWIPFSASLARMLQEHAWNEWKSNNHAANTTSAILDCPVLNLSESTLSIDSLVETLETRYGKDWRSKPLVLRNLWSQQELNDTDRTLSLHGLLDENLTIPYFTNASAPYALSPDARAPISDIVRNMTTHGKPHKIGSQFLVQTYPKLIEEVAPTDIVTTLFGNYFQPNHVVGSGLFGWFPAMTTVPVFVARTKKRNEETTCAAANDDGSNGSPRTDLHCEPIGNVAVQLRGEKQWLLVSPQHSFRLQPAIAPDGRAFFASFATTSLDHVPQYHVSTRAGDALWIPTWTWHRVDYVSSEHEEIAIGGSLFHFRAMDFFRNNPLFALLVIPSLIKEVIGYNTQ